jgi:adenine-specific DNA-methyltransferase
MKKDFFTYLKSYSYDPIKIDRIIVSNFLYSNGIEYCKNQLIENLRIKKEDPDFEILETISSCFSIQSIEDLVQVFEFVISPEDKIVNGAVYTPHFIREYITDYAISKHLKIDNSFIVCDPACGCSGFLLTAAKRIKYLRKSCYSKIFKHNLFGLDIQEFSINRSKILLTLAAIIEGEDQEVFEFNLYQGNALSFDWSQQIDNYTGFDAIIGNPPYVCSRNIDSESKKLISNWSVCKSGHPDLYIPFFEIGIINLKLGGILGYITMNTFFKSVNGRALREYLKQQSLSISILDFGANQIFHSKSTYTCICLIQKEESTHVSYARINNTISLIKDQFDYRLIKYEDLDSTSGWNLQERDVLDKIENTGLPLGKKYVSRNGIATLKNDIFIFEPIDEDENYYYLQSDRTYAIERGICYDIINPNKLTRKCSIDSLRKKVIFPYVYENNQPCIIQEKDFVSKYPKAYNYLASKKEILSTRDKGKGKEYAIWYAFGRNQSLERYDFKLFFPHITSSIPNYTMNSEPNLLFVNGLAIIGNNKRELELLKKIMSSQLFWFYIINSSKPYGSGYYSLSRNYIKNFGIFDFSEEQKDYIINTQSQEEIDSFLLKIYDIKF